MRKNQGTIPASARDTTNTMLHKANALMMLYTRATGAHVFINDHNYTPLPELSGEMLSPANICIFCIRYKKHTEAKAIQDLFANPCREMHINAIRESHRFGGSFTYLCPLGFIFWTSPIYLDGRFSGALVGHGFLGTAMEETCARMNKICGGALSETELMQMLSAVHVGEPAKIKAMSELMLICAQSLSAGSEGCHTAMKRRARQQADLATKIDSLKKQYPPGSPRPEYPMDRELKLLEMLRRGEVEPGRQMLNEILAVLLSANSDQFKHIQFRAIELAVLLSRIDIGPGSVLGITPGTNSQYIKLVQEAANIEELTDTLYRIVDDIAGRIQSFRGIHHATALKKAEHFILENFTRKVSLDEIAKTSGFSAPYFSTIFKEEMGENLSGYLNRLRVEKAGYMLTDTDFSLSKIAHECGFEDQSWFSKIFKLYTGISPGKYRTLDGKPQAAIPKPQFSDDYRVLANK